MAELWVYANEVRQCRPDGSSATVGTYSRHWAAIAAMVRYSQADFKSLGGDGVEDLAEESIMRRRVHAIMRETAPYGPMCRNPDLCVGKGYCPRDPTCGD